MMDLSNQIYSRKVLYRLIYIYNFCETILKKNIYIDFAEKIENIVYHGLDKVNEEEFKTFNFSEILEQKNIKKKMSSSSLDEYIEQLNPKNEKQFNEYLSYIASEFVNNKHQATLDYNYIVNHMFFLIDNYDNIIEEISEYLNTFKFLELNSVDQSILLLGYVENKFKKTPKQVLIKECGFLASTFSSDNSIKLITAILDKVLD